MRRDPEQRPGGGIDRLHHAVDVDDEHGWCRRVERRIAQFGSWPLPLSHGVAIDARPRLSPAAVFADRFEHPQAQLERTKHVGMSEQRLGPPEEEVPTPSGAPALE